MNLIHDKQSFAAEPYNKASTFACRLTAQDQTAFGTAAMVPEATE